MEDINNKKTILRKELLKRRNSLSIEKVLEKTQNFTANFLQNKDVMEAVINANGSIAIYFPFGKELSPVQLAKILCERHNKSFCLPVIESKNAPLKFANWDLDEKSLVPGRVYKTILEPNVDDESKYAVPSLIIAPLVGFDKQKRRIGMGAGFYDRTIEYYKKLNPSLITIGVAYDIQEVSEIPVDEYDKILDYIVTN
jgi:5-formyltetrahydrofolate cyclo-ligase